MTTMAITLLHPRSAPQRTAPESTALSSYCVHCARRRRLAHRVRRDLLQVRAALLQAARTAARSIIVFLAYAAIVAVGGMLAAAVVGGRVQ